MEANAIHDLLKEKLGDAVLEYVDSYEKGSLIAPEKIAEAARLLRDEPELHFEQLGVEVAGHVLAGPAVGDDGVAHDSPPGVLSAGALRSSGGGTTAASSPHLASA